MKFGRADYQASISQDPEKLANFSPNCDPIGLDEPVLMFRAKDVHFCSVVSHYMNCFGAGIDPDMRDSLTALMRDAEVWQLKHGTKTPDLFKQEEEAPKVPAVSWALTANETYLWIRKASTDNPPFQYHRHKRLTDVSGKHYWATDGVFRESSIETWTDVETAPIPNPGIGPREATTPEVGKDV